MTIDENEVEYVEVIYADFYTRSRAYLIDLFVFAVVFFILLMIGEQKKYVINYQILSKEVYGTMAAGFIILFWPVYRIIMPCSVLQGTIGKIIMGIKVVDMDGNRITPLRSLCRFCAASFSGITVGGIGCYMILWTRQKRALHDMISETYVIHR